MMHYQRNSLLKIGLFTSIFIGGFFFLLGRSLFSFSVLFNQKLLTCADCQGSVVSFFKDPIVLLYTFTSLILLLICIRLVFFTILEYKRTKGFMKVLDFNTEDVAEGDVIFKRIKTNDIHAFTTGIKNPEIYISQGVVDSLTADEFQAVYYHEKYHAMHLHTMQQFVLSIIEKSFFYSKFIKDIKEYVHLKNELAADYYAMNLSTDVSLYKALFKIHDIGSSNRMASLATVHFSQHSFRVEHLLKKTNPRLVFSFGNIVSFSSLCALFAVLISGDIVMNTQYIMHELLQYCS